MKKMICTKKKQTNKQTNKQEETGTPNYHLLTKHTTFALTATECSSRELTSNQLTHINTQQRWTNLQG